MQDQLQGGGSKFRLLTVVNNSKVEALACFIYEDAKKFYHIGSTNLFSLPVKTVKLFGSCVIGEVCESVIQQFFQIIIKEGDFDLINVGYSFLNSPLYKAVDSLPNAVTWQVSRKKHLWWLIRLPASFEAYIASLPERTRKHLVRDCRKFERECPELRVMRQPDEVDFFLRDAGEISRLTYQWKLNYGIRTDEIGHEHLRRLAERGQLRCYISYLQGEPCAFGWGDLSNGKFHFRETGYSPKFRKFSPGTALMMRMIKDMIENTDCRVFHFQWGGEDGYKSRLATEGHLCTSVQVAPRKKPYPLLIVLLDRSINLAKNSIGLVVESGPFKARFRSVLRRRGVGTF